MFQWMSLRLKGEMIGNPYISWGKPMVSGSDFPFNQSSDMLPSEV